MRDIFTDDNCEFSADERAELNAAAARLARRFTDDREGRKSLSDALNNVWCEGMRADALVDAAVALHDPGLLRGAIEASGLSADAFARDVLDVNERTLKRWLARERKLDPTVRIVCRAIVDDPPLANRLAAIRAELTP